MLQSSSEWLFLESVCETEAAFIWSNESHLHLSAGFTLALQSEEESKDQTVSHMVLTNTQDIVRVQGLSPGHVYHFSLVLTCPKGASQTLGPIFIANTSKSLCL